MEAIRTRRVHGSPDGFGGHKLALVSAGLSDVTFALTPKHEWDVAAGAALVESAGGFVSTFDHGRLCCNRRLPLISGLLACGANLRNPLLSLVSEHVPAEARQTHP
jgi:myo-inositol-1(or 4)-monophosphatase